MRDLNEVFSTNLKNRRMELNISQRELSKRVGVGPSAICNYERGTVYPALKIVVKLAEVLETSVDWLCTGEHPLGSSADPDTEKCSVEEAALGSLFFVLDSFEEISVEKTEESVKIVFPKELDFSHTFWGAYNIRKIAMSNGISEEDVEKFLQKMLDGKTEAEEEDAQQDAE